MDPDELLASVRGSRFGPVDFADAPATAATASIGAVTARLAADGPTVVAEVEIGAHGPPPRRLVVACGELVAIDQTARPPAVRCWARAATAGDVAVAVATATALADWSGEGDDRAPAALPPTTVAGDVPAAALAPDELPSVVRAALEHIEGACSEAMASAMRSLLLGEREQVTLSRAQLDELTGAVLGDVTVFGVGAASGGGVTLHAVIGAGRAIDVEVEVGDSGKRIEPASQGDEVARALDVIDDVLAVRGRRLARVAAVGDAVVAATDVIDEGEIAVDDTGGAAAGP